MGNRPRSRFDAAPAAIAAVAWSLAAGPAQAGGGVLVSDRDRTQAIAAWGGARDGTALRLNTDGRPSNSDCTGSR